MKTLQTQLTLHSALLQLQALNVAIRLTPRSVAIWSPNRRVPCIVRRTIQQHKAEVRAMIEACRIEVCCSPELHRREWYFANQNWTIDSATCAVCQRLAYLNESKPSRANYEKIKVKAAKKLKGQIA
jgi:hypothetical protein